MSIINKYLLGLLLFLQGLQGFSQKNVLVVPFTRFQLVSEFKIDELSKFNEVAGLEVYLEYVKSLTDAFNNYKNESINFVVLAEDDFKEYKKYIRYRLGKFKGKNYNQSDLRLLKSEDYNKLLEKYQADYILTVNWYDIDKAIHTVFAGDRNKRMKYSLHKIDYDIYGVDKNRLLGMGNQRLFCGDFPSPAIVDSKSLRASELTPCYGNLLQDIVDQLFKMNQL